MTREQFERRYRQHKIVIVPNVGPKYAGRYSVEILDSLSVLGTCNTVAEAEDLAENWLEMKWESEEEV